MEDWQVRQKHHEDVQAINKSLGHLNAEGHIWRFNGPLFFEEMKKREHDSSYLNDCRCWQLYKGDGAVV